MKKLIRKASGGMLANPDGIYVAFPGYSVDTGIAGIHAPLGHGMVIAVDENTGYTRGSEYGRYDSENKGSARRVSVPNLQMKDPGNPTDEELDAYAKKLYLSYRNNHKGNKVEVHYVKGADENKMIDLMKSAESGDRDNGYYVNHDYRILDHNCGTYGADLIKKSMPWYKFSGFGPYSWGKPGGVHPYLGGTGVYEE